MSVCRNIPIIFIDDDDDIQDEKEKGKIDRNVQNPANIQENIQVPRIIPINLELTPERSENVESPKMPSRNPEVRTAKKPKSDLISSEL